MSGPPPISVQQRILLNFNNKGYISCDDWEYAVSKSWLNKWQQLLTTHHSADAPSLEEPKSKASMQSMMGPVTMEGEDDGNEYLLQKWWKILVSWYGLDLAHSLRRRPAIPRYTECNKKHYMPNRLNDFIELSVCMLQDLSDESKMKSFRSFAWDYIDYVEFQSRRLLRMSSNLKARLWLCIQENGHDVFFDLVDDKQTVLINKLVIYLPWITHALDNRGQNEAESDIFKIKKHNVKITFALEEIGLETEQQKGDVSIGWKYFAQEIDGAFDSIVTLTTIHNQWEDLLTESLDQFTQDVGDLAIQKRDYLLQSAREIVTQKVEESEKLKAEFEEKLKIVNEKEAMLEKREQEVSSREDDLNSKLSKFQSSLDAFVSQKKRLEDEWKKIAEQNKISESKVHLNIGGHIYITSTETLIHDTDSLLAVMFSGKQGLKKEADGSYFIDRDGTHFRHILNYLRDGPVALESIPENTKILHELLIESEYYKLTVMSELIREKVTHLISRDSLTASYQMVETI